MIIALFQMAIVLLSVATLALLVKNQKNRKRDALDRVKWPVFGASLSPFSIAGVWSSYYQDKISLVSALLRVDELFRARVAETTSADWAVLDWTLSPLEPQRGSWEWEDDKLVPAKADSQGRPLVAFTTPHTGVAVAASIPAVSSAAWSPGWSAQETMRYQEAARFVAEFTAAGVPLGESKRKAQDLALRDALLKTDLAPRWWVDEKFPELEWPG